MHTPSLPTLYFAKEERGKKPSCESSPQVSQHTTTLQSLPPELLHRCLSLYADWGDLAKLACVNSNWKNLVRDSSEFGGREAMWELSMCLLHGEDQPAPKSSTAIAQDANMGGHSTTNTKKNDQCEDTDVKNNNSLIKNNRGIMKNEKLAVKYLTLMSGIKNMELTQSQRSPTDQQDEISKSTLPNDWNIATAGNENDINADEEALLQLADCHLNGIGTPCSPSLALHYLQSAYHLAHSVQAAHTLALIYEYPSQSNNQVPIDVYAAFAWFKAAAEGGHVLSMAELALCYELGCGVDQSDSLALDWYMKAAENGHGAAHYSVGEAFEEARGVPMDEEEACLWYYRAAVMGEEDGKLALKRLEHVARRVVPEAGGILHG